MFRKSLIAAVLFAASPAIAFAAPVDSRDHDRQARYNPDG